MYRVFNSACKILFIPAVFLIILCSCNDSTVTAEFSESYMPLKIGNKWFYSAFTQGTTPNPDNIIETREVVGTKFIEGRTFYLIKRNYTIPSSEFADTLYYALEGNVLYQLIKYDIYEPYITSIAADFNLEVNNKYSTRADMVYDVTVIEKTAEKMSFYFDSPNAVDEEHTNTYLKGRGFYEVYSAAWSSGKRLVKAELK